MTTITNINLDSPSLVLDSIFTWKGAGHELQQIQRELLTGNRQQVDPRKLIGVGLKTWTGGGAAPAPRCFSSLRDATRTCYANSEIHPFLDWALNPATLVFYSNRKQDTFSSLLRVPS
jgi:hypothetical protein